jgi:hypothetical protein
LFHVAIFSAISAYLFSRNHSVLFVGKVSDLLSFTIQEWTN